jgi:peroxiredoxin Q/BCP
MIEVGQKAHDFCLPNQDEVEICLKDLKGKWVVLYFYPKDNTPGCTTEAKDFTEHLKEFEELDAVVLGVSPQDCESHRKFIQKQGLKVTLLCDTDKEVLRAYGAWGKKKMYGKEYEGVIRTTLLIDPDGKIAYIWPKVRVKGHVEQVKEKLKELKEERGV